MTSLSLNTWTSVDLHPHGYVVFPLHRFDSNEARCDWWVQNVVNNGVTVLVSSKYLSYDPRKERVQI